MNKNDSDEITIIYYLLFIVLGVKKIRKDNRRTINIFGDKGYISKEIYLKCKKNTSRMIK